MDKWRKIAEENGISRKNYNNRVKKLGWTPERAATEPVKSSGKYKSFLDIAKKNGITPGTFYRRMDLGWSPEKAAGKSIQIKKLNSAEKKALEESGINYSTFYDRVRRRGWSVEDAKNQPIIKRRDRKWLKLAKKNDVSNETFYDRVDNRFWTPEEAATTPPMTRKESTDYARKIRGEYLEILHDRVFSDPNNLHTITPKHIEIAQKNGISKNTLYGRIYELGWNIQEAINKPVREVKEKPSDYEKYQKIAQKNGVNSRKFASRIRNGWTLENAASNDPHYKNRYPKKWVKMAEQNGIKKSTFKGRIYRGWSFEEAATTPLLTPGKEFLNEETKQRAREGFKKFRRI